MSVIEPGHVELLLSGGWVDATSSVDYNSGLLISRGLPNETTKPATPGTARFTLRNESGIWDPREPTSPYYGLWGRGVPVWCSLSRVRDTFARTTSNGWGTTDSGQAWTVFGTASDYATNGTAGVITASGASDRAAYLPPAQFRQFVQDVAVTWAMSATAVTGAAILPCQLMLRFTDITNYTLVRCTVDTANAISLTLIKVVAGVETTVFGAESTGYTYTAGSSWRMRAVVEGQTYRAKIWPAGQAEPYGWSWSTSLTTALTDGTRTPDNEVSAGAGIRVSIASGNTNGAVTFTFDDFEVRSPRFCGQVTDLRQNADISGRIRTVEVEAADIFRQLQTGATPLDSTLKHGYLNATNKPVSYWPLEDGTTATKGATVIGAVPMEVTQGAINFGAYDWGYGSDRIATPNNGTLHGYVGDYADGDAQFRTLIALPSSGLSDGQALWTVHTTGTVGRWRLTWHTSGNLKLSWFAPDGTTLIGDSGLLAFAAVNIRWFLQTNLTQSGGDITWALSVLEPGMTTGATLGGTVTGRTLGQISDIYLTPDADIGTVSFGHVSVQPTTDSLFAMADPLNAYQGEFAPNRSRRIGRESLLEIVTWRSGNPDGEPWPKMGPQSLATLADIWEDAILADRAALIACRASTLVMHRTGHALQWAAPRATINVAGGQLGAPPLDVDDNSRLANDVTIKQGDGNSARETKETGKNSAASPAAGGIGRIAVSDTRNLALVEDLADYASWRLAEGTFDGPRYPRLTLLRHAPRVSADPALFADLLDVELGDALSLSGLRIGTSRAHVLGYTERYDTITHTFTFNCSPGALWHTGTADTLRADADGSTLAASATSSATSLSVATSSGPMWIDSTGYPSMFPFDAVISGEVVTVTAISGTTSPQTFTATRSVNGVVKAHSAGETVSLADPYRAGFGPRY